MARRAPLGRVDATKDWRRAMSKFALPSDVDHWRTAVVLALQKIVRKLVLQTGRWASYRCRKCAGHADLMSRTGLARARNSRLMCWKSETL